MEPGSPKDQLITGESGVYQGVEYSGCMARPPSAHRLEPLAFFTAIRRLAGLARE